MRRTIYILCTLAALLGVFYATRPTPVETPHPEVVELPIPQGSGRLSIDFRNDTPEEVLQKYETLLGEDFLWENKIAEDQKYISIEVEDMAAAAAYLEASEYVESVEPEQYYRAFSYPNDPLYEKQWHMREINAPYAWKHTPQGRGVVVAVLDTGVAKVEDLKGTKILEGTSFVPGEITSEDFNGHGTHCAGSIAQTTNNGIGLTGVAPMATILPVKVLDAYGFGSHIGVASGIDYATEQGADIISMSLGGLYSEVVHSAVKRAVSKGVIVVAAAGNSGTEDVGFPGALEETIGVSAFGPGGTIAPYSSYGKGVDIAGPGGDKRKPGGGVWQNTIDEDGGDGYLEFQGTSMATPHVAGALAVLLSTGTCDAECAVQALLQGAEGTGVWDKYYGHGRLNLEAALQQVSTPTSGWRFYLALGISVLMCYLARGNRKFFLLTCLTAGFVAGGFYFLPIAQGNLFSLLLTEGVMAWPAILFGPEAPGFPLWSSALLAMLALAWVDKPSSKRALALGVACGVSAFLFHSLSTGSVEVWWLGQYLNNLWLTLNFGASFVAALALAGAEKESR